MAARIGVLVSGRGSNLQAILEQVTAGSLDVEVAIVISNRANAPALAVAAAAGAPTLTLLARDFADRAAHHAAIAETLRQHDVQYVVTAGFNRVLHADFINQFRDRIVNVHPSLLPAFAGTMHAPLEALAYGAKITGCTVHFVDETVDGGPIIAQAPAPVLEEDTEETLAARILREEHRLLPEVLRWLAEGRVRREGRRVRIAPPAEQGGATHA